MNKKLNTEKWRLQKLLFRFYYEESNILDKKKGRK